MTSYPRDKQHSRDKQQHVRFEKISDGRTRIFQFDTEAYHLSLKFQICLKKIILSTVNQVEEIDNHLTARNSPV